MANVRFVIVGDFGKDLDDEDTLILQDGERRHRASFVNTQGSRRQDVFELQAVVANLAPPLKRAMLAKGTLKQLGQPDVPVGVGTDCKNPDKGNDHEFAGVGYLAEQAELVADGAALLIETLEKAEDQSITLVLISGMTDAAALIRAKPYLLKQKVYRVAIMGGVKQANDEVTLVDGYMEPDTAANNAFDMDSAKYVYRRLQELEIPMVILTREAAYACKVPRGLYDDLAATGHPVGIKLRDTQKGSIEDLWKKATLPEGHPDRGTLPGNRNQEWFCNTFCGGKGMDRTGADSIWDLVQSFNLYDPMTLVAAVDDLRDQFYDPVTVRIHHTNHLIIGVSKTVHGVKDPAALSKYMIERFMTSLNGSLHEQVLQAWVNEPAQETWVYFIPVIVAASVLGAVALLLALMF